jgi:hypothetical protein
MKIKNRILDNTFHGGKVPTCSNCSLILSPSDPEYYSLYLLPFIYNSDNIVLYKDSTNETDQYFLKYNSDDGNINQTKYFKFNNDFSIEIVQGTLPPKYRSDTEFNMLNYYTTRVFEFDQRILPSYYCLLKKYNVLDTIYEMVRCQSNNSSMIKMFKQVYAIDNSHHILKIKIGENILDKYIFINKFKELILMLTYDKSDEFFEHNTTTTQSSVKTYYKSIMQKTYSITEKLDKLIARSKDANGLPEILFIEECANDEVYGIEYKQIYSKFNFIKSMLCNIFRFTNETTDKINFINLVDLYTIIDATLKKESTPNSIINKIHNLGQTGSLTVIDEINLDALFNYFIKEIKMLFSYNLDLVKLRNFENMGPYNIDLLFLLGYFSERLLEKNVMTTNGLKALPLNQNKCVVNLFKTETILTIYSDRILKFITATYDLNIKYPKLCTSIDVKIGSKNYHTCGETTIFNIIKLFYWNFTTGKYELNTKFESTSLLYDVMSKAISSGNDVCTSTYLRYLISKINGIDGLSYVQNGKIEILPTSSNILKCLYYLFNSSGQSTNQTISFPSENEIIMYLNNQLELVDGKLSVLPNLINIEFKNGYKSHIDASQHHAEFVQQGISNSISDQMQNIDFVNFFNLINSLSNNEAEIDNYQLNYFNVKQNKIFKVNPYINLIFLDKIENISDKKVLEKVFFVLFEAITMDTSNNFINKHKIGNYVKLCFYLEYTYHWLTMPKIEKTLEKFIGYNFDNLILANKPLLVYYLENFRYTDYNLLYINMLKSNDLLNRAFPFRGEDDSVLEVSPLEYVIMMKPISTLTGNKDILIALLTNTNIININPLKTPLYLLINKYVHIYNKINKGSNPSEIVDKFFLMDEQLITLLKTNEILETQFVFDITTRKVENGTLALFYLMHCSTLNIKVSSKIIELLTTPIVKNAMYKINTPYYQCRFSLLCYYLYINKETKKHISMNVLNILATTESKLIKNIIPLVNKFTDKMNEFEIENGITAHQFYNKFISDKHDKIYDYLNPTPILLQNQDREDFF